MKRAAFEQLLAEVLASLPAEYAKKLDNLVFLVEDWADNKLLAELGFEDPVELLGFYSGTPLTERSFDQVGYGPDQIYLYQGAIEREAEMSGLSLRQVVSETLWHEIAHYFGFSEEEMDQIEQFWAEQTLK